MGKESRRFLWSLLGIILFFFGIQNFDAVKTGFSALVGLVLPLIYGCIIGFILNLIVRQLERFFKFVPSQHKTILRVCSITLSVLILLGAMAGIVAGLVPEIRESAMLLGEKFPRMVEDLVDFAVNTLKMPESWFASVDISNMGKLAEGLLENDMLQWALKSGGSLVGGALNTTFDLLVGLCFSFYLLMQKEKLGKDLRRLAKAYLSPERYEKLMHIMTSMNEIYSNFISGQCLDALILGVMITAALWIFQIDYALLIGIVVAFTALVPVVGAFIGGAVGAFLLLMVSPKDALLFLILFLILQQVDNRLVYPHVVGSAVGLPAIWIFAAIVLGGNFGGIFGMILAIPLFALVYTLLAQGLRKREAAMEQEKEE